MPHSLRSKIKNLCYKRELSEKERDRIIKALEQQPCEDCISREAVIDAIDDIESEVEDGDGFQYAKWREYFCELPSVTPQQQMGTWIHREYMDYLDKNKVVHNHFMCQDCGFIHDFIDGHTAQYKYCPNCGAKMEVRKDDK